MYSDRANPASHTGQQAALPDPPPSGGGAAVGGGGGNVPFLPTLPPRSAPHDPAADPVPTTPTSASLVCTLAPRNEVQRGEEASAQHEQVRGPSSDPASSPNPQSKIPNPKSPPLSPDLESLLLLDAAAGILDAQEIAAKHNLSLTLYLDWYAAPTTATRLSALLSSREHTRITKYQVLQDEAAATLRELHTNASESSDPIERRRSSTALLRFTTGIISGRSSPARLFAAMGLRGQNSASSSRSSADAIGLRLSRFPSHFRARSRKVREVPILHEPPAILPPPYFPHKDASPSEATIELLHRLQCNDNPRAGDGLRNLFNYFSPKWREAVEAKTADDFACTRFGAYHSLIAHHSAVLHPTQFPAPASSASNGNTTAEPPLRATQRFDLINLDGNRFTGTFHFTRASPSAPWFIDFFELDDDDDDDDDDDPEPDPEPEPEPVPEPGPPNSSCPCPLSPLL